MNTIPTPFAILLSLCVSLVLIIIYERFAPLPSPAIPHFDTPRVTIPTTAAIPPMPASNVYSVISERPLFAPLRQKIIAPKGTPQSGETSTPPPLPSMALVGIIIDNEKSIAILKPADAAFANSMTVGDRVGAWQLASILPDRIILAAGTNREEIRLDANKAASPPTQPAFNAPSTSVVKDPPNNPTASP
jgi:hypothetical protein